MLSIETDRRATISVPSRPVRRRYASVAIMAATFALAGTICAWPPATQAQDAGQAAPPRAVPSIEQRVDAFVSRLETARQERGVVGAAVVVAHGDRIVRAAGLRTAKPGDVRAGNRRHRVRFGLRHQAVHRHPAQVVHVPERRLSFALLTNQDSSSLAAAAQELFWDTVVAPEVAPTGPPATPTPRPGDDVSTPRQPIAPQQLTGRYFGTQGVTFDVRELGGGLASVFSGQPPYPLKATGVNSFELTALSGYSLSFAEPPVMPGRIAAFLRQPPSHPGGNISFLKQDDLWLARAKAQHSGPDKELIGSYLGDNRTMIMEIVSYKDGVALIITGQTPWLLKARGGDLYQLDGLPETYQIQVKRSGNGGVAGFTLQQPNLRLEMSAAPSTASRDAGEARRILDRAVAAAGGAEALDGITSMSAVGRASALTHGLEGRFEDHLAISAGKRAQLLELGAFGKTVFKVRAASSAQRSVTVFRDGERVVGTGKALLAEQLFAVPHPLYRWKQRFATVAALGEVTVNGEGAYVIELTPRDLAPTKLYVSTKTFLVLREEVPAYDGDELQPSTMMADYSDYRAVSGVQLPFAGSIPAPMLGRVVVTYDSIALNGSIDPKLFDDVVQLAARGAYSAADRLATSAAPACMVAASTL